MLFFDNTQCQQCGSALGYLPKDNVLAALEKADGGWKRTGDQERAYRQCQNVVAGCNWLIEADSKETFCAACRHNRTIPDLTVNDNMTRWRKLEAAKRRMFYSLIRLGLPLANREDDPEHGLAFDFLAEAPAMGLNEVLTGHHSGVITINLMEADDAERVRLRNAMSETYRTLLGHFRHEVGHHFWDLLVRDGGKLDEFREYFGDERVDYAEALRAHYANGPKAGWQENFISGYASVHPWEDFAETWSHYLHITDTLEMASAFGIRVRPPAGGGDMHAAPNFDPYVKGDVSRIVGEWVPLAMAVNAINRCMGEQDLYPFVLNPAVEKKLGFVHMLMRKG